MKVAEWDQILLSEGPIDTLHLVPVDDLVGHETSRVCVCGPHVEELLNGDVLVVHWALDGRP